MKQEDNWLGKVAIVTGGSSGIGKATALALAAKGANVVITGRDKQRLDEAAKEIDKITPIVADSAESASAQGAVDFALGKWGQLDLVVNNAGAGRPLPVDAYTFETISEICSLNIVAPSLLVSSAAPALRKTRGAIVNIGTALSRNAAPMLAHYAASKAALEHLTKSWAVELAGDGIRVNAIAPGPVKSNALTGMMGLSPEMAAAVEEAEASQVPLGRRGVTDDLVPWILTLGSSGNEWVTGQVLTIDGGWSDRQ